MFKHLQNLLKLHVLAASLLFAACGGGGDEGGKKDSSSSSNDSGGNAGAVLVCIALVLVSGDDGCVSGVTSGGSSSSGGSATPPSSSGGSSGSIRIRERNEIEPNNESINANVFAFPSEEGQVGAFVNGAINGASDQADHYTFVRERARNFRFQLCPPDIRICERTGTIDTLTAYFDVLDQDGNVLLSSQAATKNIQDMRIEAGISYYVRVVAGDTMGTTVSYGFTAYELN